MLIELQFMDLQTRANGPSRENIYVDFDVNSADAAKILKMFELLESGYTLTQLNVFRNFKNNVIHEPVKEGKTYV